MSDKPIAEIVTDAQASINWCYANVDSKRVTWSVAEDFLYLASFESTFTTIFRGKEEKIKVADEKTGLPPEVRKWGEALAAGKLNEKQIPEEALADLELVSGAITIRGEKGADICAVGKHAQKQRGALGLCISDMNR